MAILFTLLGIDFQIVLPNRSPRWRGVKLVSTSYPPFYSLCVLTTFEDRLILLEHDIHSKLRDFFWLERSIAVLIWTMHDLQLLPVIFLVILMTYVIHTDERNGRTGFIVSQPSNCQFGHEACTTSRSSAYTSA